jgi:KDO2-lipid IV(A) lauroyltransferase
MDLISVFFLILGIILIGIIPASFLYGFSNFFRFIIFRVAGYRKKIVRKNLEGTFPDLPEKELNIIMLKFYTNLADIFLEGLWAFTMSKKQIFRRHRIINMEAIEPFIKEGKSMIAVPAHYGNWEWGSLSASSQTKLDVVAFYKPINNKYIDKIAKWNRSRFGTTLAPIKETTPTFQ